MTPNQIADAIGAVQSLAYVAGRERSPRLFAQLGVLIDLSEGTDEDKFAMRRAAGEAYNLAAETA